MANDRHGSRQTYPPGCGIGPGGCASAVNDTASEDSSSCCSDGEYVPSSHAAVTRLVLTIQPCPVAGCSGRLSPGAAARNHLVAQHAPAEILALTAAQLEPLGLARCQACRERPRLFVGVRGLRIHCGRWHRRVPPQRPEESEALPPRDGPLPQRHPSPCRGDPAPNRSPYRRLTGLGPAAAGSRNVELASPDALLPRSRPLSSLVGPDVSQVPSGADKPAGSSRNLAAPSALQPASALLHLEFRCAVCLELQEMQAQAEITPCCCQSICSTCILSWVAETASTCPSCRSEIRRVNGVEVEHRVQRVDSAYQARLDEDAIDHADESLRDSWVQDPASIVLDDPDAAHQSTPAIAGEPPEPGNDPEADGDAGNNRQLEAGEQGAPPAAAPAGGSDSGESVDSGTDPESVESSSNGLEGDSSDSEDPNTSSMLDGEVDSDDLSAPERYATFKHLPPLPQRLLLPLVRALEPVAQGLTQALEDGDVDGTVASLLRLLTRPAELVRAGVRAQDAKRWVREEALQDTPDNLVRVYESHLESVAALDEMQARARRHEPRPPPEQASAMNRTVKDVRRKIERGHIGQAARRAASNSTCEILTEEALIEARRLFPPRQPDAPVLHVPAPVDTTAPIFSRAEVRALVRQRRFNNGSAPDVFGWTPDLASQIIRVSDIIAEASTALMNAVFRNALPPNARRLLLAGRLVLLRKPNGGRRPIVVPSQFSRLASMLAVDIMRARVGDAISPDQYGIRVPGGAATAVHVLQATLEAVEAGCGDQAHPAVLSIDFANAYGNLDRQAILDSIGATPALHPLTGFVAFGLGPGASNLAIGRDAAGNHVSIEIQNGIRQGDPASPWLYCLTADAIFRHALRALSADPSPQEGMANATAPPDHIGAGISFLDDNNAVGSFPREVPADGQPGRLLGLLDYLRTAPEVRQAGLLLSMEKSFVLLKTAPPEWFASAATTRGLRLCIGWARILGAPVGWSLDTSAAALRESLLPAVDRLCHTAREPALPVQHAWLLLRMSAVHKVSHISRTVATDVAAPLLNAADEVVREAALDKLALPVESATPQLLARLGMPTSLGGAGLVPAADRADAAFVSGATAAAPHIRRHVPHTNLSNLTVYSNCENAIHRLLDAGVTEANELPSSAAEVFDPDLDTSPHRQAMLTTAIFRRRFNELSRDASAADRAVLQSLRTAGAAAILHAVPTEFCFTVPDDAMRAAIRMRIGAPPIQSLPATCIDCGHSLDQGRHCIGGCSKISATVGRVRHDLVVSTLNSILRADAGVTTTVEPLARGPVAAGNTQRRQDLLLAKPGSAELDGLALDIGITSPASATALRLHHSATTHLAAARAMEAAKCARYEGIEPGARFQPVVFENTGAAGERAASVLKTIAVSMQQHAAEIGMTLELWRAAQIVQQRVAVALHRGNWRMIAKVVMRARSAAVRGGPGGLPRAQL